MGGGELMVPHLFSKHLTMGEIKSDVGIIHPEVEAPPATYLGVVFATRAAPKGPGPDPLAIDNGTNIARAATSVAAPWPITPE